MKKGTLAIYRAAAALIAAVILLGCSGFGFVDMLKGPETLAPGEEIVRSPYLAADVTFVMDIVGVEKNAAGKETAYYAVSPVGDTFVLFRFPAADLENIRQMEQATDAFLQGESFTMDFYMTVTGSAAAMDEAEGALLLEWFEKNVDWMVASGVIAETEDYSTYLTDYVIRADTVGGHRTALVLAASILAALLVAYAIVEVVLVAAGAYEKKPAPKAKKEKKPAPVAAPAAETPAPETSEETKDA